MSKILITIIYCFALIMSSEVSEPKDLSLTIYNNNFGMVKDTRVIKFDQGISSIYFTDVAKTIQPQTVAFTPTNKKVNVQIYQQNYQDNLANKYSILAKYVGKQITVHIKMGSVSKSVKGTLLAYSPAFLIKTDKGVNIYDSVQGVQLSQLPEGMLTQPTLVWKCNSKQKITTQFQVSYRATGFSWKSDYIMTLSQDQKTMDFAGWVTIDNKSGKRYANTKLKLIAGDVNIVKNKINRRARLYKVQAMQDSTSTTPVKQKSFADYHMYTLSRKVDINQSSSKQIQFLKKAYGVNVNKYYSISLSSGGYSQQKINADAKISFKNSVKNSLGIALPKGTIRVFKRDQDDNSLQFIGEDSIDHTPKNEDIQIKTGKAFDIVSNLISVSRTEFGNGYQANMKFQTKNHGKNEATIKLQFNNYNGDNLKFVYGDDTKLRWKKQSSNKYTLTAVVKADTTFIFQWKQQSIR